MSDNVFQPTLSEPAAYNFVAKPVQDQAAVSAVNLATKVGVAAAKKIAVHDLTGGTSTPEEAAGQALNAAEAGVSANPNLDANQAMAMESIDNLSKLSRARKAGLGLDQARDRARAVLARSVNDNPLFADDIRKAYASYFGGSGGSGNIFDATPEEKANIQFREDVQMLSNELQVQPADAAARIRVQREQAIRLKDIEVLAAEQNISGDAFNNWTSVDLMSKGEVLKTDILAQVAKTGPLTPEQKTFYINQVTQLAAASRSSSLNLLRGSDGKLRLSAISREDMQESEKKATDFIDTYKKFINNNDLQSIVSANKEITDSKHRIALLNSFGPLIALQEVGGRDGAQLAVQALLDNKPFATIAKNQPFMASVLNGIGTYDDAFGTAMGQSMQALMGRGDNKFGIQQDNINITGTVAGLQGPQGPSILKMVATQEDTTAALALYEQSFAEVPESIVTLNKPAYKGLVATSPETYKQPLQAMMLGTSKGIKRMAVLDSEDGEPNLEISHTGDFGDVNRIELTGDGASDIVKTRFKEAESVARTYPVIWQDDFESVEEYLATTFAIQTNTAEITRLREELAVTKEEASRIAPLATSQLAKFLKGSDFSLEQSSEEEIQEALKGFWTSRL